MKRNIEAGVVPRTVPVGAETAGGVNGRNHRRQVRIVLCNSGREPVFQAFHSPLQVLGAHTGTVARVEIVGD